MKRRKINFVARTTDLILLKMVFCRDKDLREIRGILWSQRGKLDVVYMRLWSGRMLEDEANGQLEYLIREYQ